MGYSYVNPLEGLKHAHIPLWGADTLYIYGVLGWWGMGSKKMPLSYYKSDITCKGSAFFFTCKAFVNFF